MDYSYNTTDGVGCLNRFIADINAMPSVSLIDTMITLRKSSFCKIKKLIWCQGIIKNGVERSASVRDLRNEIDKSDYETVGIVYKLIAPNRRREYINEILSLSIDLLERDYIFVKGTTIFVSGTDSYGDYWSKICVLEDSCLHHSGVRPSPKSAQNNLTNERVNSSGW